MAEDILHIKDTYYFEVPKALWRSNRKEMGDFPNFWIRNDGEFQDWEASLLADRLSKITTDTPSKAKLIEDWKHWQHAAPKHANSAKPLDVYLEEQASRLQENWQAWVKKLEKDGSSVSDRSFEGFLKTSDTDLAWFAKELANPSFALSWRRAKQISGDAEAVAKFQQGHSWSAGKVGQYNAMLHGKILIRQPLGELRNLYQVESGLGISKFMILEVVVALIIVALFTSLAKRTQAGEPPKGRLWNLLESLLIFVRDEIGMPTMGAKDAAKFTPLLWTIFMFVLGCNLMGMVPWAGSPTGSFGVTLALAGVTVGTGMVFGMKKFGFVGFWLNLLPSMDLPWWISPIIKPLLFGIELLGFCIKHLVLGIRLLANMVAGHLVLLGIMGLAFTVEAARSESWHYSAVAAIIGATLFSCLELFVAFLQAYLFTFLSSLFIASSTHRH